MCTSWHSILVNMLGDLIYLGYFLQFNIRYKHLLKGRYGTRTLSIESFLQPGHHGGTQTNETLNRDDWGYGTLLRRLRNRLRNSLLRILQRWIQRGGAQALTVALSGVVWNLTYVVVAYRLNHELRAIISFLKINRSHCRPHILLILSYCWLSSNKC